MSQVIVNPRPVLLMLFSALAFVVVAVGAQAQEVADLDIPIADVTVEAGHLEIKVGKSLYRMEDPKIGEADRESYESMSVEEKTSFDKNRQVFVAVLARGLHFMKYGFGVGAITKNKIKYRMRALKPSRFINLFRPSPVLEAQAVFEERARLTLKETSNEVILAMLRAIDRKLWNQAPLFARSNEFGIVTAGGLELIAGVQSSRKGGLIDIGVAIGYNRDDRSLAIQIFLDYERYQHSIMPAIFIAGAVGKLGIYVANQKTGELKHEGTSYYPPMAPAFSSITKDNFMTGLSTGLTWPPSPIGDMLTYTDKLNQTMLFRVSVSPFTRGFVRVGSGVTAGDLIRIVVAPVRKVIANILSVGPNTTCEQKISNNTPTDAPYYDDVF